METLRQLIGTTLIFAGVLGAILLGNGWIAVSEQVKLDEATLARGTEAQRRVVFVFDRAATWGYQKAVRDCTKSYNEFFDRVIERQKYKDEQRCKALYGKKTKTHR